MTLRIEWLDKETPKGEPMLVLEREALECKDGTIADIFIYHVGGTAEIERCTVELYKGWGGDKVETLRWRGPNAYRELNLWMDENILV